jgi:hypothetical protein
MGLDTDLALYQGAIRLIAKFFLRARTTLADEARDVLRNLVCDLDFV